ncbi:DUF2510 domain-containing protein [Microbacterium sp. MAHUQ-60]|uniref:DUF2510 domain-containing protein n=1 Tax=unclassified Microbacterium TaxID=2609290 RepID=UPI003613CB86
MTVPAGWYDDGSGRQRWWDGAQWTEHFAPVEATPQPAPAGSEAPEGAAGSGTDAAAETAEEFDLDATARRDEIPRAEDSSAYAPPTASAYPAPEPVSPAYAAPAAADSAYTAPAYTAPAYTAPAYTAPAYTAPEYTAAASGPRTAPVLGFIGLGLAVLGTILACIPTMFTLIPGLVVLFAALVISIIAVFRKNTRKWPAVTGIVLSVVGGVIGIIVTVVVLFFTTFGTVVDSLPSTWPTPMTSDWPTDTSERPLPEQITAGYLLLVSDQDDIEEYIQPGVAACIGEHLYESDLSDETLWDIATGMPVADDVYPEVQQAADDAADACLTQ